MQGGFQVCKTKKQPLMNRPMESGIVGFFLKISDSPIIALIEPLSEDQAPWDAHDRERSILANGILVDSYASPDSIQLIMHRGEHNETTFPSKTDTPKMCWKAKVSHYDVKMSLF